MSETEDSLLKQTDIGLGAVEKLIKLLKPLLGVAFPDFRAAARGFQVICKKLLDANENLTRWVMRFRNFDFTQPDAGIKFRELSADYRALKVGPRYQELKFSCDEIASVYWSEVRGRLKDLFAGEKLIEAQSVFEELSSADARLVEFVHQVIFESLDRVCSAADVAVEQNNFDAAEDARLTFKVESGPMIQRLEAIGSDLADLVLQFRRLAFDVKP